MKEQKVLIGHIFKEFTSKLSDYKVFLVSINKDKNKDNLPAAITCKAPNERGNYFIRVAGLNLPDTPSIEIKYYGRWQNDKSHGLKFVADTYSLEEPIDKAGTIKFLSSGLFEGLGPVVAERIYETFGKDTFAVLREEPYQLLRVKGVTNNKLSVIIKGYERNKNLASLTSYLASFGFATDQIAKINNTFGDSAMETIKKNPYCIQNLRGITFAMCEEIASDLNFPPTSPKRIASAISVVLRQHINLTGDTAMLVEELEEKTLNLLNKKNGSVEKSHFRDTAKALAGNKEIVFRGKCFVTSYEYDRAERQTTEKLKELLSQKPQVSQRELEKCCEKAIDKQEFTLSVNQRKAVITALTNKVSIITGGPGTGKSTILSAILDAFKLAYPDKEVVLLSPTGKAARRMAETTGEKATTIHSKLQMYEGAHDVKPLPDGLTVIDESSMVDTKLLEKLVEAMPIGGYLLFIGDKDQLPSVGAGSVLNDMISSGEIPTARLTDIYRQKEGSSIIDNAQKINTSKTDLYYDQDFEMVKASSEKEALDTIKRLYAQEVAKYGVDNVALLTPLRKLQKGRSDLLVVADNLNHELQEMINPKKDGVPSCSVGFEQYRLGDRVMQWHNGEKASNGDIGVITGITNDGGIKVEIDWENGNKSIEDRESMLDITLAYAISIHKSQGSQYDSVIIPMLRTQKCPLFKRNLLYTAVTRAKKKVILVGEESVVSTCIKTEDAAKRRTLFRERLKAAK